jgi:hypothetical protein
VGVVRGRAIGNTSVVFKLELDDGKKAAFKPNSRRGPRRYKGELASHRLAGLLGIDNVPPAHFRAFAPAALRGALSQQGGELFDKEVIVEDGKVRGALMPWIEELKFAPIEREPMLSEWRGWLKRGGAIPDAKRARAREIAILVAFDSVTGNWDRWSGGNVGEAKDGRLLFIDNDGSFMHPFPEGPFKDQRAALAKVERFSRSFVAKLRALDEAALTSAIGDEEPGRPLLSSDQLKEALARKDALLKYVDDKIAANGDAETLFFE